MRDGCGRYAHRIHRPRASVCAGHPATTPLAAVRRSAAGIEARRVGSAEEILRVKRSVEILRGGTAREAPGGIREDG